MMHKELSVAKEAAKTAGVILRRLFGKVSYSKKKGDTDLVSEADFLAEKAIMEIISRNFPQDSILAEESGGHEQPSDRVWLIDPLDGTTNFVHGFPFFSVSIGLEIAEEMVVGVVYNPSLDELFEAAKGEGAFLNERPIKVSQIPGIKQALLVTGFPYNIHERPKPVLERFGRMLVRAQGVRRPGSASIDMCYVAAGRFDGFWEQDLHPWDTAAGKVIVEEAGGKVSDYRGEPYTPYLKSVIASNGHIHGAMIEGLNNS